MAHRAGAETFFEAAILHTIFISNICTECPTCCAQRFIELWRIVFQISCSFCRQGVLVSLVVRVRKTSQQYQSENSPEAIQ
jgi:hypothetical protein